MAKEYLMVDGKLVLADGDLVQVPDAENLNDLADENGALATQSNMLSEDIENLIVNGVIDGSPRGVYENLSALQTSYPSGAPGVYLTKDNGHWYYWNGTAWTDGGVYQSSDGGVEYVRIDDDIYNTDFFINYLNNYNINLTDFKNQTVCFESYSGTDYYDYFVFLTNYDNEAILLCDGGVFNISYSINGYKKYNIVQKVTGDLANLQTTDKTSIVNAINEINTISKANTNDINKLGLSLTDLKESLYGYVLDTQDVTITDIIPNQANGYNLVDNVRGLVKSVNGNTIKVSGNNLISYVPTTLNSTNSVGDTIATITANGSVININRTASSGSNTQNNTIQLSKSLSANTQYTFKLFTQFEDSENFGIIFMNSSGQILFQLNNSTNKQTYTPSSDITQVRVLTSSGTYTKDLKIMCIEGSTEPNEFESAEGVLNSVEYEGLKITNLKGVSNTLLPFTTTLRGVGTAKDKIVISENKNGLYTATKISNVGSVDMGTLDWSLNSGRFIAAIPNCISRSGRTEDFLCETYSYSETTSNDKTCFHSDTRLYVYDSDYTNATDFKNAMSGVMLFYELATPITEILSTTLTESDVMTILELGGSVEANGGSTTMEMVYKLINTTSEVLSNE